MNSEAPVVHAIVRMRCCMALPVCNLGSSLYELQSIFTTQVHGHGFLIRENFRDILNYKRVPYVHNKGSLNKANADSSSYTLRRFCNQHTYLG